MATKPEKSNVVEPKHGELKKDQTGAARYMSRQSAAPSRL